MNAESTRTCMELLDIEPPDETNLLYVTCTPSTEKKLTGWCSHVDDDPPANVGVIKIGDEFADVSNRTALEPMSPEAITMTTISSPTDLTRIGMALEKQLTTWSDESDANQIVVCLHSITMLLQYTSVKSLFRLLHVFTSRLSNAGAVAHYHMNPGAHDDQTLNLLLELFDVALKLDDDGDWQTVSG